MAPTLLRNAALTDARSESARPSVSILIEDDRISWIRPADDEDESPSGTRIIDASGSTIVPSMVDCHSHVTLPGGAHWISRIEDSTDDLVNAAEHNGDLLVRSGVRWARDVGSPRRDDPDGTGQRGLAITMRDRWRGRRDRPYIRAAGTWISAPGVLGDQVMVEAADGDALAAAVAVQLDDGADLIKLYLDGPDADTSPFTTNEVSKAVAMAHGRGARVTAHATRLSGAKAGVEGGVDAIEHGDQIDSDVAAAMASRGTFVVTTHSVFRSWLSFGSTTSIERFAGPDSRQRIMERWESARASVKVARAAGVQIAGGSDFGGGSLRAGHLAWEVESLVDAGLEPWEALAAVTWRGGDLLEEPAAGVITEGGPADLFAVHGDPLSDPTALWRVWFVA